MPDELPEPEPNESKIKVEETLEVPEPDEMEPENEAEPVEDLSKEDIEWIKSQRKLQANVSPGSQPPQVIDVATLRIETPQPEKTEVETVKKPLTRQQLRRRKILSR